MQKSFQKNWKEKAADTPKSEVVNIDLMKLRFGSYTWEINPSEVKVEYKKETDEEVNVNKNVRFISSGTKLRRVEGKGTFFGEGKEEKYEALEKLFLKGKEDVLVLPGSKPFMAEFTFLRQLYPEGSESIGYEFIFYECIKNEYQNPEFIKSAMDESLWDIAFRFNLDINALVMKNPHIENINFIKENEVMYL